MSDNRLYRLSTKIPGHIPTQAEICTRRNVWVVKIRGFWIPSLLPAGHICRLEGWYWPKWCALLIKGEECRMLWRFVKSYWCYAVLCHIPGFIQVLEQICMCSAILLLLVLISE